MKTHQNKRVLITAGGAGIGYATAEAFLASGARVHICDISGEALDQVRTAYPEIGASQADVSDPAQVDHLFDEAVAHLGRLDVMVNNAGIAGPTGRVEEIDPDGWAPTFDVNITGQFLCCRRAVPLLRAAGGGAIVNISTTAGIMGYPLRSPYAASKWAVIGFTKSLAMELGESQIRANAICPGSIDGPRMDRVIAAEAIAAGRSEEEIRSGYTRQASLQTFIQAEEIAQMILYLTSAAGAKISGQVISVDGHNETLRTDLG